VSALRQLQVSHTLPFQLQDTVLLFATVLLLDPVHFQKYEACLLSGTILNFEALGAFIKNSLAPIAYTFVGVSFNWSVTCSMP